MNIEHKIKVENDPAYDQWLQAEVQEAIDDTDPTVPHDEVMRQVRAAIAKASI